MEEWSMFQENKALLCALCFLLYYCQFTCLHRKKHGGWLSLGRYCSSVEVPQRRQQVQLLQLHDITNDTRWAKPLLPRRCCSNNVAHLMKLRDADGVLCRCRNDMTPHGTRWRTTPLWRGCSLWFVQQPVRSVNSVSQSERGQIPVVHFLTTVWTVGAIDRIRE